MLVRETLVTVGAQATPVIGIANAVDSTQFLRALIFMVLEPMANQVTV